MKALGFNKKWIRLVLSCISSVSYSIFINGQPSKTLIPSRGLRQGDPLSPYLFLMCAESLNLLIKGAELRGELQGLTVARGGTRVSHILFIDDSILYCRVSKDEWGRTCGILNIYERGLGEVLNEHKSSIYFSMNTYPIFKQEVIREVDGSICGNYDKYLGLPALIGKSKYNTFRWIKKRVWCKVSN